MRVLASVIAPLVVALGATVGGQAGELFTIDAKVSSVVVHVGRAGLFAFAGHDHEVTAPAVSGAVVLDRADPTGSRVTVTFDATAMKVTGQREPAADVPEVQRVMLSEAVLDVRRYPTITFLSHRISPLESSSDRLVLQVQGDLTLHGTTRPVSVVVEARLAADRLTATGRSTVRQSDFGIRPVTAGGGSVRVKDQVEVVFTLVAGH